MRPAFISAMNVLYDIVPALSRRYCIAAFNVNNLSMFIPLLVGYCKGLEFVFLIPVVFPTTLFLLARTDNVGKQRLCLRYRLLLGAQTPC